MRYRAVIKANFILFLFCSNGAAFMDGMVVWMPCRAVILPDFFYLFIFVLKRRGLYNGRKAKALPRGYKC